MILYILPTHKDFMVSTGDKQVSNAFNVSNYIYI